MANGFRKSYFNIFKIQTQIVRKFKKKKNVKGLHNLLIFARCLVFLRNCNWIEFSTIPISPFNPFANCHFFLKKKMLPISQASHLLILPCKEKKKHFYLRMSSVAQLLPSRVLTDLRHCLLSYYQGYHHDNG